MDRAGADFLAVVNRLKEVFGSNPVFPFAAANWC